MVDPGVVEFAWGQVGGTPVGGDAGDDDDSVGEAASELGLEEVVAFALDAEPDGIAEVPEDDLERIRIAAWELVEAMQETVLALGESAKVSSTSFIACGAGGGFLVVPALPLLAGLAMPKAVATSLLVVAMKSFAGLAGYLFVFGQ